MADQPGTVYVLGSVHLNDPAYPLDRSITDALVAADHVVLEVDSTKVDRAEVAPWIQEHGLLKEDETLESELSPETYAQFTALLERLELPVENFDKMRPWLAAMTLSYAAMRKDGFTSDSGVDHVAERIARNERSKARKVHSLETMKEQLELLASLEALGADTTIEATVEQVEANAVAELFRAYNEGDPERLFALSTKGRSDSPEIERFYARAIDERNDRMVQGILPFYEKEGVTVVTVGAMHVLGERGILEQLAGRGADVEPVAPKGEAPAEVLALAVDADVFRSERAGFEMRRFGQVSNQSKDVEFGPGLTAKAEMFMSEIGANQMVLVLVSTMPPEVDMAQVQLDGAAINSLERMNLTVSKVEPTQLAEHEAVEVIGSNEKLAARAYAFVDGMRLFSIIAIQVGADATTPLSPDLTAAIESFRVFAPQ